jgi:hypothetical protein
MMEFKKAIPYNVVIEATINGGFLVGVGCVNLVYTDTAKLTKDLAEYLKDPDGVVKKHNLATGPVQERGISFAASALGGMANSAYSGILSSTD